MHDSGDTEFSRTAFSRPNQPSGSGSLHRLPVLVVMRGAQVGRRYLLNEKSLVIGRRPDRADLVVPGDTQVSSVHCRIECGPTPDSWQVVDLSSTNGTMVEGQRITSLVLRDGDRVHVGETVLKFCFHDELEEEFHRQVDSLMNIDDLTGLPVQRVFQGKFYEALMTCMRRSRPMTVLMMDMDGLKRINDSHGHLVGAHTIATVGRRLGVLIGRAAGVVSRFGGDEFSAYVPNADLEQGLQLGEEIRAAVANEAIERGAVTVQPTISIGLAVFPQDGQLAEQLTRKADEALYRAKAAGRNRVST
ncbi:MAG TPA: GGDEF domain-containing protein [Planctomycetota bacterium]|nr:GGDEF domain-containing protein [Planctomycetota bacterium]